MPPSALPYPPTPTSDQLDQYHGVTVADPYRWLEEMDSEATRTWVAAQQDLCRQYLDSLPLRDKLQTRLLELWDHETISLPIQRGDRQFFFRAASPRDQDLLYVQTQDSPDPRVVLDPRTAQVEGQPSLKVLDLTISQTGKYISYRLGQGIDQEDMGFVRIRAVDTGKDLPDTLIGLWISPPAWTNGDEGFFYVATHLYVAGADLDTPQYPIDLNAIEPDDLLQRQELFYHRLGTPQSEDLRLYHCPIEERWSLFSTVTLDYRYLLLTLYNPEHQTAIWCRDLTNLQGDWVKLIPDFVAGFQYIANQGTRFWFETNHEAPLRQVVTLDLTQPGQWQTTIPEGEKFLFNALRVGDEIVAHYCQHGCSELRRYSLQGDPQGELPLPGLGVVTSLQGGWPQAEILYTYTSFTTPAVVYRYDSTQGIHLYRPPAVPCALDDYETRQVLYPSSDGTLIPLFLVHRKDLEMPGAHPTLLYGYGGFGIQVAPVFSAHVLTWVEMGGVYAIASVRGGGQEMQDEWHSAALKTNRQQGFDDFIAAGEWLIEAGYCDRDRLGILGGSNGGLMVAACMTQRPDLFKVVMPWAGVMDMLRFNQFTIGHIWESEYGSPQNEGEFHALYRYSPLHNVKPGTHYPATLIMTGDADERVVPCHSFKFAAALQAAQAGDNPILLRVLPGVRHSGGLSLDLHLENVVDQWAFAAAHLGLTPPPDWPQPQGA